jgi:soluble lytic murein transglycosylase
LFEPATNLDLGTAALMGLVGELGEVEPALAAYNAGRSVARDWWSARPAGQRMDEWIESIPYAETRLYVKAVVGDWRSYRALYGGDVTYE